MKYIGGELYVCQEAVEGIEREEWTEEDVEHLREMLIEEATRSSVLARPGLEAVYAKLHLVVRGTLPPVEEEGLHEKVMGDDWEGVREEFQG